MREALHKKAPLIHSITNPISINDCANIILSIGGKPIMAEHPLEVKEITSRADALVVNLGNITDARMEAMLISGKAAKEKNIPALIDLVGAGCSKLRLKFAEGFLEECSPAVIKGNMSEIKAIAGLETDAAGVDASEKDKVTGENIKSSCRIAESLSKKHNAVVAVSGEKDIITDGESTFIVENGVKKLSEITGSGCMQGALMGAFLSVGEPLIAAAAGASFLGIAGEYADKPSCGIGTFRIKLFDSLYLMTEEEFTYKLRLDAKGAEHE